MIDTPQVPQAFEDAASQLESELRQQGLDIPSAHDPDKRTITYLLWEALSTSEQTALHAVTGQTAIIRKYLFFAISRLVGSRTGRAAVTNHSLSEVQGS